MNKWTSSIDWKYYQLVENILHFGCDYVGISTDLTEYDFSQVYASLSQFTTNTCDVTRDFSDVIPMSKLTFTNIFSRWEEKQYYNVSLSTEQFTYSILQIEWSIDNIKLKIYWKFFRFCHIHNLDWYDTIILLIHRYLTFLPMDFTQWTFYRFDHALDVFDINVEDYYSLLNDHNKRVKIYQSKRQKETIYVWSRESRYSFARLYNKLLHADKDWYAPFYRDYFQYNNVTRVEHQFLREFFPAWNSFTKHFIEWELQNKILAYLWISNYDWKMREWKRYNEDVIIDSIGYSERLKNMLVKWAKNNLDFKSIFRNANFEQDHFIFRVKRKLGGA